jgi:hypothetical protein
MVRRKNSPPGESPGEPSPREPSPESKAPGLNADVDIRIHGRVPITKVPITKMQAAAAIVTAGGLLYWLLMLTAR